MTSVEERLSKLEALTARVVDVVQRELQGLSQNDQFLGDALESHDTFLGALRIVLTENKLVTNEQLDAAFERVVQLRAERQREHQRAEELADIQARAEVAASGPEFPAEAFIFGG